MSGVLVNPSGTSAIHRISLWEGETQVTEPPQVRSERVDFGPDAEAPEAPDIGVAIALAGKPANFGAGKPILLHGSFSADMALVRLCREGVSASILVTLIRTDRPWGKTLRLVTPKSDVARPEPPVEPGRDSSHYREGGQFKVDIAKFFAIPAEPGKYQVEAIVGRHHSQRLDFEVQ